MKIFLVQLISVATVFMTGVLTCGGATIFGSLTGTVSGILETGAGDAPDAILVGQTATVTFSYESDAAFSVTGSGGNSYNTGLDLEITIEINGLVWSASDTDGLVGVGDELVVGPNVIDRIVYEINPAPGPPEPVYASFPNMLTSDDAASLLDIIIEDTGGAPVPELLNSQALPTSVSDFDFAAVTYSAVVIDTRDNVLGDRYRIVIDPDLNSFALAPEPSRGVLALIGLVSVMMRRRRVV